MPTGRPARLVLEPAQAQEQSSLVGPSGCPARPIGQQVPVASRLRGSRHWPTTGRAARRVARSRSKPARRCNWAGRNAGGAAGRAARARDLRRLNRPTGTVGSFDSSSGQRPPAVAPAPAGPRRNWRAPSTEPSRSYTSTTLRTSASLRVRRRACDCQASSRASSSSSIGLRRNTLASARSVASRLSNSTQAANATGLATHSATWALRSSQVADGDHCAAVAVRPANHRQPPAWSGERKALGGQRGPAPRGWPSEYKRNAGRRFGLHGDSASSASRSSPRRQRAARSASRLPEASSARPRKQPVARIALGGCRAARQVGRQLERPSPAPGWRPGSDRPAPGDMVASPAAPRSGGVLCGAVRCRKQVVGHGWPQAAGPAPGDAPRGRTSSSRAASLMSSPCLAANT
jgi:hypothetical protein